jgi:uncharacterized membrane protein
VCQSLSHLLLGDTATVRRYSILSVFSINTVYQAYFENSFDGMFGVISRTVFEARLRSYLDQDGSSDDDPAWYALRNTVYACGCRIELSRASFATSLFEAEEKAWQFFQKALSVHTELLYLPTGLMAVEALTAMVRPLFFMLPM